MEPNQPVELTKRLVEYDDRLSRLENEIFPDGPGGTPLRLKRLAEELAALQSTSQHQFTQIHQLDDKINEVIRIVAELRDIVEQRRGGTAMARA
jgi:hypothetical protein